MQYYNIGLDDKPISIDRWHQIVNDNFGESGGIVYSSSGSTKKSRSIIYTPNVLNGAMRRTEELIHLLPIPPKSKIAILWGYGLFPPAHFYSSALSQIGHIVYPIGSGRNLPIEIAAKNLNTICPNIIIGMPSYLFKLASLMNKKEILESLSTSLFCIISGGELLSDDFRDKLQFAFNASVFDSYGMLQAPMIASECSYKRMHISKEYLAEVLVDNEIKPFGQGSLLLSSKQAWAPLEMKRLNTEDIVFLSNEPCPCGCSNLTIKIIGRSSRYRKIRGQMVDLNELINNLDMNGFEGKYYIELISDPTDSMIFHVEKTSDVQKMREIIQKNISFSFTIHPHSIFSQPLTATGKIQHLIERQLEENNDYN